MGESVPAASTFDDLIRRRAGDEHPAILFEDESCSWADYVARCDGRARLLASLCDPQRPPHVAVLLDNVPEYLYWLGAAALGGATIVGVNPTRRGEELANDVRQSDNQLLVTDEEHLPLLAGLDIRMAPDRILVVDSTAYHELLAAPARTTPAATAPESSTRLLLLFTSGSTGRPKAVICSQGRLARIAVEASERLGLHRDDVLYESMPLFHGNAIMMNWAVSVALGATLVLRRRFSASGFLPDVRRYGATYFNYVGRSISYVLAVPASEFDRDHHLRLAYGTEASARDIVQFQERFGCPLVEGYGSSEGAVTIRRTPETPPDALGLPPERPDMDVIVADEHTSRECPRAEFDSAGRLVNAHEAIGELVNRAGAQQFEGYYANEAATNERLRHGWYWTGDLGYRDAAGFFYFAGRSADRLRVDSENFAATPVERIVSRLPGVLLAAVYPVPDARTGDQVMVALQMQNGAQFDPERLGSFLAEQEDLGTKWAPRYVRVVDAMPVTSNRKIDKAPLRLEGWAAAGFWRPGRDLRYAPLTEADSASIRAEFAAHGRERLVQLT